MVARIASSAISPTRLSSASERGCGARCTWRHQNEKGPVQHLAGRAPMLLLDAVEQRVAAPLPAPHAVLACMPGLLLALAALLDRAVAAGQGRLTRLAGEAEADTRPVVTNAPRRAVSIRGAVAAWRQRGTGPVHALEGSVTGRSRAADFALGATRLARTRIACARQVRATGVTAAADLVLRATWHNAEPALAFQTCATGVARAADFSGTTARWLAGAVLARQPTLAGISGFTTDLPLGSTVWLVRDTRTVFADEAVFALGIFRAALLLGAAACRRLLDAALLFVRTRLLANAGATGLAALARVSGLRAARPIATLRATLELWLFCPARVLVVLALLLFGIGVTGGDHCPCHCRGGGPQYAAQQAPARKLRSTQAHAYGIEPFVVHAVPPLRSSVTRGTTLDTRSRPKPGPLVHELCQKMLAYIGE